MSDNKFTKKIQPVLLGADLNCYHVARAFHEQYGIISEAFGKYPIGSTMNTRIVRFNVIENLDDEEVLLPLLNSYAENHKDCYLILMGCTDEYAALIIKNKDALSNNYIMPCPHKSVLETIVKKEYFYNVCREHGLSFPLTSVVRADFTSDKLKESNLGFSYPIIIKPSYSAQYWHHPFDGMKKVYCAKTEIEANDILNKIFASGYDDSVILQDMIPGNDEYMYVLTSYSDKNGKVRAMCLGHVLLEEHTPKGLGNHAAIITECNKELMERFRVFLEETGYVGFSNFDIKFDERDGTYRVFEINLRQGRSNYYVTATGTNIAKLIVDDYILDTEYTGCNYIDNEIFWRYVPYSVVKKHVKNNVLLDKTAKLKKDKKDYRSLHYKFDLKNNIKRYLYVLIHESRHKKKFKTYYKQ